MAEEEKNSLHKSDGYTRPRRENTFRLHYFPEIPIDGSGAIRNAKGPEGSFQRAHYSAGKSCPNGDATESAALQPSGPSEQRITEIETQAYVQGYSKGESEGLAAAEHKTRKAMARLEAVLNELTTLRKQIYAETEAEVVELVLAVVRKVICAEVRTNPQVIAGVLSEALQKVESYQKLLIRMHPKDLEFFEHNRLKFTAVTEDSESVKLEADSSIGRGGCVVETESGSIDARIEKQLNVIEESFRSQHRPAPD